MYDVDDKDAVVPLNDVPQSSVGAPIPCVLAEERTVVVAYYLQNSPPGWNGRTVRLVSATSDGEPVALVRFAHCYAHMFGPPNDEAFSGHPLADRGLRPYGAFEIVNSSWIRKLERMNSVHPYHQPAKFRELHHYALTFHDSTFECVCRELSITTTRGSIESVTPQMIELLGWNVSRS